MDKNIKTYTTCYQVLFNKPLRLDSKLIYGFRIKEDELEHKPFSKKQLLEYIVEGIFGKVLFELLHGGSFKGRLEEIWIDIQGNEYIEGSDQTRLYSYEATVVEKMNYRCDTVYVEEGEGYWITDPQDYFDCKARMDADDHKQGKNQWMQNYYRIKARKEVLSYITVKSRENLDYDIQELIKKEGSDTKGYENADADVQNKEDELPF